MTKRVITEQYRPTTKRDLIGNIGAIDQLEKAMKEEKKIFLYGDPGIGKTSAILALANDLGFAVIEVNASDERTKEDLETLYFRSLAKGFREMLYLLDEVDGIEKWEYIEKMLSESPHCIVLIANDDYRVPKKVKDMCTTIRFYRPRVQEVLEKVKEIAREEGQMPIFSGIGTDVRSSLNASFYGGERRQIETQFEKIDSLFRKRPTLEELNDEDLIWLLDNLNNYYSGRKLFEAMRTLTIASKSDLRVLRLLPEGKGKVEYPYTLRRMKAVKYGK